MNAFVRMRRGALHGLLALFMAGLQGCGSMRAADPVLSPPKPNESVVVISITVNTAEVAAFDTLSIASINATDTPGGIRTHLMQQLAPGMARDTAMYIGVLPAGEYQLSQLSHHASQRSLRIQGGMSSQLGSFRLVAGKPADLGRLVLTPYNTGVLLGRSARVTTNLPLLQTFAPAHAKLLEGGTAGGWSAARAATDEIEDYALSRPVGADRPAEMADGSVVAASRLGTALVRTPAGRWTAVRSGSLESLLDVVPSTAPGIRLLAAGEFGTLLKLRDGNRQFERIDIGDLPPGNLLFVDGNDTAGWYVFQQIGKKVTLYHSPRLDGGQWRALRTETVGIEFWTGTTAIWMWHGQGGFGYGVSDGGLHWFDFATATWTDGTTPGNERLLDIVQSADGRVGVMTSPAGGLGGVFANLYTSDDRARTWSPVKSDIKIKFAAPRRLPSGAMLLNGGHASELLRSDDQGRSWQKVGTFPQWHALTVLPSGKLLAVGSGSTGYFDIQASDDEGKTWRVEHSNLPTPR